MLLAGIISSTRCTNVERQFENIVTMCCDIKQHKKRRRRTLGFCARAAA